MAALINWIIEYEPPGGPGSLPFGAWLPQASSPGFTAVTNAEIRDDLRVVGDIYQSGLATIESTVAVPGAGLPEGLRPSAGTVQIGGAGASPPDRWTDIDNIVQRVGDPDPIALFIDTSGNITIQSLDHFDQNGSPSAGLNSVFVERCVFTVAAPVAVVGGVTRVDQGPWGSVPRR